MGLLRDTGDQRARDAARAAFLQSPIGQARTAFDRGDLLLQVELDLLDQRPVVIPSAAAGATTRTSVDPTEILNAVCREGWELVTASMAQVGGAGTAARCRTAGYYLFRRAPNHRSLHGVDA